MNSFLYESQSARVLFGIDKVNEIKDEISILDIKNVMVISSPQQEDFARSVAERIGEYCGDIFPMAVQHVPVENVKVGIEQVRKLEIDGLVAVGGGSAIGLAKAIALSTSLPIVAIPTTYAGSEMTPIWGITENGLKKTGKNVIVKPKTVIYDPKLTLSLPPTFSITSGMNGIAHCVEGLYSEHANPIISLLAEEGIRALSSSLPILKENPNDLEARAKAQYGTMLGGVVLGSVGMALHHKLCHTLGGSYNLPHAETHTVILPYVTEYNSNYAPAAMEAIGRALNVDAENAGASLYDLATNLGIPISLEKIGMKEENLNEAAELATQNPYYNPRPVNQESIRALLQCAFEGIRPEKGIFT
ncbi:maleylacetate reductase [Robertmurraya massiliosenegalensis]|uniref:maleylacetate reductase n=1 Tax=Robertmurraya TaxID=2837507 RepID=UPI0039A696DC